MTPPSPPPALHPLTLKLRPPPLEAAFLSSPEAMRVYYAADVAVGAVMVAAASLAVHRITAPGGLNNLMANLLLVRLGPVDHVAFSLLVVVAAYVLSALAPLLLRAAAPGAYVRRRHRVVVCTRMLRAATSAAHFSAAKSRAWLVAAVVRRVVQLQARPLRAVGALCLHPISFCTMHAAMLVPFRYALPLQLLTTAVMVTQWSSTLPCWLPLLRAARPARLWPAAARACEALQALAALAPSALLASGGGGAAAGAAAESDVCGAGGGDGAVVAVQVWCTVVLLALLPGVMVYVLERALKLRFLAALQQQRQQRRRQQERHELRAAGSLHHSAAAVAGAQAETMAAVAAAAADDDGLGGLPWLGLGLGGCAVALHVTWAAAELLTFLLLPGGALAQPPEHCAAQAPMVAAALRYAN